MNTSFPHNSPNFRTWDWQKVIARYENPDLWRSIWQLVNTIIPYFGIWYLMYRSLEVSYWVTLALSVVAAGFVMRIFIIFHDCGHGSFFRSQRANDFWGWITGILTFTPYYFWRNSHARHHATSGDLDRRGAGDIWTMTVEEYQRSSGWKKFAYRFSRHPVGLLLIGPAFFFLIRNRVTLGALGPRERFSVHLTNLLLLNIILWMSCAIGFRNYMMVQLPITMLAASAGVWLFYVQHQFEGVYWERHADWNYVQEAMEGSSYYKLPIILQWFSGNIGFHHIHHLSPRIPNYHLQRCYNADPIFRKIKPITFISSLKSLAFHLWDEKRRRLIAFRDLGKLVRA